MTKIMVTATKATLLGLVLMANSSLAQVEVKVNALEVKLTGRAHVQFNTTSVDSEKDPSSLFVVSSARLTVEIKVTDFVSGKIQPDYSTDGFRLEDAYMDLNFHPAFIVRMGQFKRGFDFFGLESLRRNLVVERDGVIRGFDVCSGVGRICSYSRFTEELEFSDRDIGLGVGGVLDQFVWSASVTNGEGANKKDKNDSKSFSGRLELWPNSDTRIGANIGGHDFVNETTGQDNDYAYAFGADVNWGSYDGGWHVQAGITAGDNWRNLDSSGDPSTFVTTQAILAYRFPLRGTDLLDGVVPLGRVSWGDPNTDSSNDDGILFTPGVILYLSGLNRFAMNADIYSPGAGQTEWSFKAQMYLAF